VQSAFKYDNPIEDVITAIKRLKSFIRHPLEEFDESFAKSVIEKTSKEYQEIVEKMADLINLVAKYVPRRRMRKLHVGLFGYARTLGRVTLPRAIGFCAACYSIGLPPEIFGLSALTPEEIRELKGIYRNLEIDFSIALRYLNTRALEFLPEEVRKKLLASLKLVNSLDIKTSVDLDHKDVTTRVLKAVKNEQFSLISDLIVEGGLLRKFLG
jgi:phosphoenolpyruvate carboxylase